uniref:Uncharacterized protein n=1 Tax=Glossina pallidipes TaxID=7398 RepID=A0A1A9Z4X7_GLOPL
MSLSWKLLQSRTGLQSLAQRILRKSDNSTWSAKKVGKINTIDKTIERCPDIRMGIPSKEYSVKETPYLISWDDKYHPYLLTSKVERTKEIPKRKVAISQKPKTKWLILSGIKRDKKPSRLDDIHYKSTNRTCNEQAEPQEETLANSQPSEDNTNIWTSDLSTLAELNISRADHLKKQEAVKLAGEFNPEIMHHNLKKKKLRESRKILSSIRRPKMTKYIYRKNKRPSPNSAKTLCPVPCYWEYWRSTIEKAKLQKHFFEDENDAAPVIPKSSPNKVKQCCPIPSYSEYLRNTFIKTPKVQWK